jgi:hypothetical protein
LISCCLPLSDRTINAGKSVRNEDHACVYRSTLRAYITDESITSKVSDMMPTVPGYPHQIPVGAKRVFPPKASEKPIETNEQNGSQEKSDNKNDAKQVNGTEGEEQSSNTTTKESVTTGDTQALPLTESTVGPNLDDLMSPTTPIPLEIRLSEAAAEIVESAYTTPETSPQRTVKSNKEESLPWLYFAVFDGHAGQSPHCQVI